ncbi:MAG: Coenzyme F420 hydrogenase/dehydrogenase, beta subunit C-terminal domain [Bacteroidaceae bacterium]|nr:Coenzyme F420 hydrogenase/dehydrogenase, beta subunit C-terminal domain [Bacteroidaceae bacterium]
MIQIKDKKDCCGCTACMSICAHSAISMVSDDCGFVFPEVNSELCVNCTLCEQVCPIQNIPHPSPSKQTYVTMAKDPDEQRSSTSGGVASVLARHVIGQLHGVVYGCSGKDCHHVRHIRVDSVDGIDSIKGSKYVQSNIQGILSLVKEDLRSGRHVLFVGTPCQVAALRNFLRKPYERLCCIDFVCHGVPSQKVLTSAIREQKTVRSPREVKFRIKENNKPSQYCLQLADKNSSVLYKGRYGKDFFMTGFIYALFYRESCYACPFANTNRMGDITVGDFWDKDKEYQFMAGHQNGLSQMHVNTYNGSQLINQVKGKLLMEPIALGKLLVHSEQLSKPMPRHRNADMFWELYHTTSFQTACKKALATEFRRIKWQFAIRFVFALPGFRTLYFCFKKKAKK